jgi:hypothetical protein
MFKRLMVMDSMCYCLLLSSSVAIIYHGLVGSADSKVNYKINTCWVVSWLYLIVILSSTRLKGFSLLMFKRLMVMVRSNYRLNQ